MQRQIERDNELLLCYQLDGKKASDEQMNEAANEPFVSVAVKAKENFLMRHCAIA